MLRTPRRLFVVATFTLAAAIGAGAASAHSPTGPSSSQSPYLVRSQPGVVTKSILTVGDAVNAKPDGTPYRMVGIPDGLGAFDNGDGTFTLLVYVGTKTNSGSPIERAGLTNGSLYGVKVTGVTDESPAGGIPSGSSFSLYPHGNVENTSGAALEAASNAGGVTHFQRPEDGAWDPKRPNDFYFVTTASFTGNSRLWRLRFADRENPAAGGTLDMLLDGSEGQKMMDNLTITRRGDLIIQEDPGGQDYLARVWRYNIKNDTLTEVARHDPARFAPGAPGLLTIDEESSGVIDMAKILGDGWFLLDVQAHYANGTELVEGGQLLALHIPPGHK